MQLSKNILVFSSLLLSQLSYANTVDITGLWRSIDDKTGFSKAIIKIQKDNKGIYTGSIIEIIPRPDYIPKTYCYKCPAPYTNHPILGLQILTGIKVDPKKPNEYSGGKILDPLTGKIYKSRIKINSTGDRINMRGFMGVEIMGRSQTWIRHTP